MIILKVFVCYYLLHSSKNLNSNMIILKVKTLEEAKLWLEKFKFQYDNT